jgi:WD40 repeat protein
LIRSVAVSNDGSSLLFGAIGGENLGSLVAWNQASGQSSIGRYDIGLTRVGFSPDENHIASTAFDNTVVLWDASTGEPREILVSDQRGIDPFAWSADGKLLAAADNSGQILLWELP